MRVYVRQIVFKIPRVSLRLGCNLSVWIIDQSVGDPTKMYHLNSDINTRTPFKLILTPG